MTDPVDVVRRYFEVVADLGSSQADLEDVLHEDVEVIEHPNSMNPGGALRDRQHLINGFLAGKELLATQSIELHETLAEGERVAVRATFRAATKDGTEFVAHLAGWLRVADGRIREHETFDCYEPFTR